MFQIYSNAFYISQIVNDLVNILISSHSLFQAYIYFLVQDKMVMCFVSFLLYFLKLTSTFHSS